MGEEGATTRSRAALWLTLAVFAVHAVPLAASLRDYRVSVDSGYHVSLARWYAEHHSAWWDSINFQPRGRPNLQGPALHVAIAVVGRLLGGTGDAYVLANAILAFLQWLCAVFTVWYFARREGGDEAGLIAVALLTGSAFVAGSFYVGLPSGWIFIVVPWAIDAFQKDRPVVAGRHTFRVRATDGTGALQIEQPAAPHPNGATGYHAVTVSFA